MRITKMAIIGYIHVCQKGEWKRSFKMLIDSIKSSGLYEATQTIRLGVVNDSGSLIEDEILNDQKFDIVYVGKSEEYERATLYHMRLFSEIDDASTMYYYLHTKGLRHFGTESELNVVDWIELMLFWNIETWKLAVKSLNEYQCETYGCNFINNHYSGNFWWAKASYIRKLPTHIGKEYNDPEFWICLVNHRKYNAYSSGLEGIGHYYNRYPRELYDKK